MNPARVLPTYAELIGDAAARLAGADIDTARLDAEVLLGFALGVTRSAVYARLPEPASPEVTSRLDELVERRSRREPIAYITGVQEFWSLPFAVTPAVLIPRPETESLVEIVRDIARAPHGPWAHIARRRAALARGASAPEVRSDVDVPRFGAAPQRYGRAEARPSCAGAPPEAQPASATIGICEIGTGSGCIAVALARELPDVHVVATDISTDALVVARRNAARHRVDARITFVRSDVFESVESPQVDVIVSNPPYLRPDERVCPELAFEPQTALEAGPDGLAVIRRLIAEASLRLRPGGWLAMEIGATQADAVRAMAAQSGFASVAIERDLAGLPRVLVAQVE